MWQVLLAAAIAGSGYVAKQLLHKNDQQPTDYSPQNLDLAIENGDAETSILDEDTSSIFRFSSSTSYGSKNPRRKLSRGGGIKGTRGNHERKSVSEKKIGDGLVDDQRKSGKKFTVCLKKRRTGRNASAKCESFDVKDKSSFGWGVGVGIMYMMSAGKAEINKLNTAVDETAKIVQELKIEISKRKSSRDLKVERTSNQNWVDIKSNQSVIENSSIQNNDIESYDFPATDEVGDASSMITDEPNQEVAEMDQLEAELESELLKLHVSEPQDHDLEFNQSGGVVPYELDQKLCHLLIEQQESQIVDLESELQRTNSKLFEKESELQALKDCVKRLTEFSLTCPSDEEKEGQIDEAHNKLMNGNGRSMVGIKRAMDFV